MKDDLLDVLQSDAVDNRIYKVSNDVQCVLCNRTLKGKLAYLIGAKINKNKLKCHDDNTGGLAIEALICNILQCCNVHTHDKNIRLTKVTIKKIDRALKDQLEI